MAGCLLTPAHGYSSWRGKVTGFSSQSFNDSAKKALAKNSKVNTAPIFQCYFFLIAAKSLHRKKTRIQQWVARSSSNYLNRTVASTVTFWRHRAYNSCVIGALRFKSKGDHRQGTPDLWDKGREDKNRAFCFRYRNEYWAVDEVIPRTYEREKARSCRRVKRRKRRRRRGRGFTWWLRRSAWSSTLASSVHDSVQASRTGDRARGDKIASRKESNLCRGNLFHRGSRFGTIGANPAEKVNEKWANRRRRGKTVREESSNNIIRSESW